MGEKDLKLAAVLLVIGVLTHLPFLGWPNQVIFDEVHFGKFVTAYCCTGENFFDIHPPHAKLLIAGVAKLGGYDGGFSFENIGQDYGSVPVWWMRFIPALTGSVLAVVVFWLLLELGARSSYAFFGGWLVAFDNAMVVQTRIIALDGLLLLSTFGSLAAVLVALRTRSSRRWGWWFLAGSMAGMAAGVKFTGLAALGLVGVVVLVELFKRLRREKKIDLPLVYGGVVVILSAVFVYAAGWAVHYSVLPSPGSGDAFYKANWKGNPVTTFVRETVALHKVMLGANYNLEATHPYASSWQTWPIMKRPVFYWQGDGARIYFLGNPIVWWGSSLALAFIVAGSVIVFGQRGSSAMSNKEMLWIPLLGFVVSLAPLARVPRALFLYHYLTPLVFAIMICVLWIQRSGWLDRLPKKQRRWLLITALVTVAVFFIVFSPITYGIPLGDELLDSLVWLKTWR